MHRNDGRSAQELRPIVLTKNAFGYAAGSVLVSLGNTKVLCSVTMQHNVPPFIRGQGVGWLSAEYAMLPTATQVRTTRSTSMAQRDGRAVEISRLIGRALRSIIDFSAFPDRTILIDCDVLQADGGTRTVSLSAACLALYLAQNTWIKDRTVNKPFLTDMLAGVAVGVMNDVCLLDPSYQEDSNGDADINFIIARSGGLIEVQGGAEKKPINWNVFEQARVLACSGAAQWFTFFDEHIYFSDEFINNDTEKRVPLFSLKNRQQNSAR